VSSKRGKIPSAVSNFPEVEIMTKPDRSKRIQPPVEKNIDKEEESLYGSKIIDSGLTDTRGGGNPPIVKKLRPMSRGMMHQNNNNTNNE